MTETEKQIRLACWFRGRSLGAIGIFYEIGPFIATGPTREACISRAQEMAYKRHDLYISSPTRVESMETEEHSPRTP